MNMYFAQENELLTKGLEPSHELQMNWIEDMVEKYKDNPSKYVASRNLQMLDSTSLVRELNG
jgi:hypothetical protein